MSENPLPGESVEPSNNFQPPPYQPPVPPQSPQPMQYAQAPVQQPQQTYAQQPQWGPTPPTYMPTGGPPRTNVLAIISLVAAFFVPIAGVICGHIALVKIKATGEGGRGLAIAGLVVGYVNIVAGVLFVALTIVSMNSYAYSAASAY